LNQLTADARQLRVWAQAVRGTENPDDHAFTDI
jgi:hypothetical protein